MNAKSLVIGLVLTFTSSGCYSQRWEPEEEQMNDTGTAPVDTSDTDSTIPDVDGDGDHDGFTAEVDCDDTDPGVYPGAEETCEGTDQNCSGVIDEGLYMCPTSDNDFDDYTPNEGDCDDYNPLAHPGALEECDGFDNDCDNVVDEPDTAARQANACEDVDGDGDGWYAGMDCDDTRDDVNPGALDVPYNGVDENCSGGDLTDVDGDTHNAVSVGGDDCDDVDPAVHPGITEVTGNGKDDDCDIGTPDSLGTDVDLDGNTVEGGDCDDGNNTVYQGAPELCDGLDNDCDEVEDDNVETVDWYIDADHDGHGDENATAVTACAAPDVNHVQNADDCDDLAAEINPGATEIPYNGVDENCADGDANDIDCDLVAAPHDCDDANADRFPGNVEVANDGVDQDCDLVDLIVDLDADDDGANDDVDCAPTDPARSPNFTEIAADQIDNDCDGQVDEVAFVDPCAGGYSQVFGTFTAPAGATILSISGSRTPDVGVDDLIPWTVWGDDVPLDMNVETVGNVGDFSFERCVNDAATWYASVAYTLPGVVGTQYDCMGSNFTGTWEVDYDSDVRVVTAIPNGMGGCQASWR